MRCYRCFIVHTGCSYLNSVDTEMNNESNKYTLSYMLYTHLLLFADLTSHHHTHSPTRRVLSKMVSWVFGEEDNYNFDSFPPIYARLIHYYAPDLSMYVCMYVFVWQQNNIFHHFWQPSYITPTSAYYLSLAISDLCGLQWVIQQAESAVLDRASQAYTAPHQVTSWRRRHQA